MRLSASRFFSLAILAMSLAGCQQLFTTSLGAALARKDLPIPPVLSSSQASDLAAQAKANNDTKLASALVSKLVDQIAAMPASTAKTDLQASAASAAIVASGSSAALTGLISNYSNGQTPSSATLTSLLTSIQTGASGKGVVDALTYLDPGASGGLSASDAKAAGLGATDLAMAAVVIAASAIPAGSDPTTFDYSTLSTADQAKITTAKSILSEASTLVVPGSDSANLLDSLKGNFNLKTP